MYMISQLYVHINHFCQPAPGYLSSGEWCDDWVLICKIKSKRLFFQDGIN